MLWNEPDHISNVLAAGRVIIYPTLARRIVAASLLSRTQCPMEQYDSFTYCKQFSMLQAF
jgi:hypothetical protein